MSVVYREGGHKGHEASIATQKFDALDPKELLGVKNGDDIDVDAAVKARKEFDAAYSPEDLQKENELLENNLDIHKKPLADIGRDRAAAIGQKISSAKKGMGGFLGRLMDKLKDVGASLLAPDVVAKRAAGATADAVGRATDFTVEKAAAAAAATRDASVKAAKATARGVVTAGKVAGAVVAAPVVAPVVGGAMLGRAIGKGVKVGAERVSEGALGLTLSAIDKVERAAGAAKNVAEIGFIGALAGIDSGVDAVKGGAKTLARGTKETAAYVAGGARDIALGALDKGKEHVVRPVIEKAQDAWGGLMERGSSALDALAQKKDGVLSKFREWNLARLEKKAARRLEKWKNTDAAMMAEREKVEALHRKALGQREALTVVDAVQPEPSEEVDTRVAA